MSRRGGRARCWVAAVALLAGLLATAPAAAQSMSVEVEVIYATNAETGIDPALGRLAQSFASFRYSAYKRVGGQMLRLAESAPAGMAIPGGRRVELMPRRLSGEAADLRVTVYEAGRKLVASEVRLARGGQPVIVGGFKHQDGVLFLAIQAMR